MRPLHLLLVLAVLAALLLATLSFLGRGSTPAPAGGPATERDAARDASETAPAGNRTAALDGTGGNADANRTATPASFASEAPAASGAATRKAKPTVALSGRVVGELGKPIEGATVYAADRNELATVPLDEIDPVRDSWIRRVDTTTDASGRFQIRPEAGARVSLAVRAPGFAPLDREFTVTTPERDLGDLTMDASVILSGRVVTAGGRPIEHARIARLSAQGDAFAFFGRPRGATLAETDAQGSFRVDQLSAGPWHLLVSEEDHPDLVQNGETERPGTVVNDLLFTLADGADIRGRITGAPAGAAEKLVVRAVPRSGEEGVALDNPPAFSAGPRTARCASDGTFVVKGLRKDEPYRLVARDAGREPFGGVRSSAVNARAGDRGVELIFQPETALVFQVVDAKSGKPVVDLDVQAGRTFTLPLLDEVGRPIRHFQDGRVRYGGLPPSARGGKTGDDANGLKIRIEAAGYQVFERADVPALEGQDNDLGIVRLEPAPVVRVLVLDAGTKAPVADAQVALTSEEPETKDVRARVGISIGDDEDDGDLDGTGSAHRARTGADGRAVVTSFPGKSARIRVRHAGHSEFRSEPIALPEKDDLEQTVSLGSGGSVTVVVVDPRGNPVASAEVDHEGPNQAGEERVLSGRPNRTDADGKLAFDHLQPGSHRFRLGGKSGNGVFNFGGGHAVMRRVVRGGDSSAEGWASVEVTEGSQDGLRLVAPEKGSLAGKITEAGKPLANATVRLAQRGAPAMPFMDDGRSAHTDGTGDYVLDGVEEGEYTLTVEHATRAMPFESDTRVRAGENKLDLDLSLAIVEGTVTGEDGKPVAGVRVRAERSNPAGGRRTMMAVMVTADGSGDPEVTVGPPGGGDARSTTDENGKYALRGVLADVDLVVQADPKDAQPAHSETFKVKPDETKKGVDLKLERGGSIQVAVARAGKPVGGFLARATLVDGEPVPKIQFVGPSGSAKLNGLKPGKWKISLDPIQGKIGSDAPREVPDQEVDVRVGETAKANFDVP
jgi:protocatechuate 3,4-dioxygenase beta subunit